MPKRLIFIFIGAIVGGILGAIPGFRDIFALSVTPLVSISLGVLLGGGFGGLIHQLSIEKRTNTKQEAGKMQLREEQLDISKIGIKTGDVSIYKEVLTEEKNFTVPVTREELVIVKTDFKGKSPKGSNGHQETVRIPICEERVDIIKSPVTLEDVEINSHQYQGTERIEATLKKEKMRLETTGNAKVVEQGRLQKIQRKIQKKWF